MASSNTVDWFDIPVIDLDRAMQFYEQVVAMPLQKYAGTGIEGALFPGKGVRGTLLKADGFIPSKEGSVVYF